MSVYFHSEEINFKLDNSRTYVRWVTTVIENYAFLVGNINVIFTSNSYLLKINRTFLKHTYFTDVITFNYNDNESISGDIFISIEQVKMNCVDYKTDFLDEINRVIIHGILHLIGFNDSTQDEIGIIREEENKALQLFDKL